MTKVDDVFMLDMSKRLNFETMLDIYKSGFTRIPVYEHSREFIKGILYVKDLILVDPDDEITLEAIVTFRYDINVCRVKSSS
jgi:metal transporter CNNM